MQCREQIHQQNVSMKNGECYQRRHRGLWAQRGHLTQLGRQGRLSGNGSPNGIPTHMHNSRDSTRRLSRAMPSGCTSLPESPAARCSVCRAKRIFRHASSSSGAASDPPRLLQEPAFLGRLSQKTNSKLFRQSKLRASHPAPGATTLPEQLWFVPPRALRNTGRVPPIISFAQKKVTFFQVASWKLC